MIDTAPKIALSQEVREAFDALCLESEKLRDTVMIIEDNQKKDKDGYTEEERIAQAFKWK